MIRPAVFLDTNVLLTGFAAFRRKQTLPAYIVDPTVQRYSFEKCIFESYMAFRGIGGKKPDEGRGNWADSHLDDAEDPSPVGKLSSKIHGGDTQQAYFWINQILEAENGISSSEHFISMVSEEDKEEYIAELIKLQQLTLERAKFERLCDDFRSFLQIHTITIIPYCTVYDLHRVCYLSDNVVTSLNAGQLDSFARDTALPSEDLEIVFAALSLPADLFVTDDKRLITCAMSLGLNFRLGHQSFCTGKEYTTKIAHKKATWGIE